MADTGHPHLQSPSITRTFFVAYLLTGSTAQAEDAMLEAIASWSADRSENELFEQTIRAALRPKDEQAPHMGVATDSDYVRLPAELQAVLRLTSPLRHCFVLRTLVGMSRQACSRLLELTMPCVDQHTCDALRSLPSFAVSHSSQSC